MGVAKEGMEVQEEAAPTSFGVFFPSFV